jgi:hypothetical protein
VRERVTHDLARIERQWPDILRVVASIHTDAVPAYDILRVLAPGGMPTQLGQVGELRAVVEAEQRDQGEDDVAVERVSVMITSGRWPASWL